MTAKRLLTAALAVWAASSAAAEDAFRAMKYRPIGPFRGGRSAAVTGVVGRPGTFYFGAAGGGVWKTVDAGNTWKNVSDGFFGGSVGAVAVCDADPNVIYVGGGEVTVRGNVSHGDGVWKSTDAGKTWKHVGLKDSRRIPRVRVHPKNPDVVYVAALGHLFGPNAERGVFRSTDGGESWKKVLFVNNEVGACDLILDPNNPRIIYASTWRIKRTPFSLESGGDGSGLWKSTDAGDTWEEITRNDGLPKGTVGIIGVAVSPADSDRVWAMIEAKDGGLFRSDDAGKTWRKINSDRTLRQRAWYYTRVYADPKDRDKLYVVNVRFWRSKDGGKSFSSIRTPHGDHHDLWIDPDDTDRMAVADDGGAQVSTDGGANFSTYMNQPTAQFYRVTTDSHFPYRIYGAQQDNSTVRIASRASGFSIGERDWEPTAGGESGHIAPKPDDPEIVYGGSYAGYLARVNHRTNQARNVTVWPDQPIGHGAGSLKYRFQWNFPLFFSPHDNNTLYAAGNVLFKTNDSGQSWTPVSPDLTRNDKSKLGPSGGPITKDNTTVEYYCTIFAACESPHEKGVLWAGSDDGLLHVSRDAGKNWADVTPPEMPEWAQVNSIEPHPTEAGGLYVAATCYKLDDFKPYLFKTTDYGKTWKKITNGIKDDHFTRVVRADPGRAGLLYAGTERGVYTSFDDGANWGPFQLNLPVVPVTDLAVKENDLIVATQGRSFWVLDDVTPLHQWKPELAEEPAHLYEPRPTYRMSGGATSRPPLTAGQNAPGGVVLFYHLKEKPAKGAKLSLTICDAAGKTIREFQAGGEKDKLPEAEAGMNRFAWDMRYPDAKRFPGLVMWAGSTRGPLAPPGTYKARLTLGDESQEVGFKILKDPRSESTGADLKAQFDFLIEARDKLTETHGAIIRLRDVRSQIQDRLKRTEGKDDLKPLREQLKAVVDRMTEIEERLYQTKNRSPQDPLNFPIRLNNKLASVAGAVSQGSYRPTAQAVRVRDEITTKIDAQLKKLRGVFKDDVRSVNEALREAGVPAVYLADD